jgi:hypothetical protein
MSDNAICEPDEPTVNEQVEQLTSIFVDFRRVLGVGFKHAHQNGFGMTQFIILGLIGNAQAAGEP